MKILIFVVSLLAAFAVSRLFQIRLRPAIAVALLVNLLLHWMRR